MSQPNPAQSIMRQASAVQYQATNPHASIWVSASAGTGKTKVLTDRVLALLLQGNPVHRLLCLTYTKAAATEMSNRLQTILGSWVHMSAPDLAQAIYPLLRRDHIDQITDSDLFIARQLFARVLDAPGGLKIMTLHAFCQSVLKRFPLEAGIAPHFDVIEDRTAQELLKEAYETILQRTRQGNDPNLAQAIAYLAIQIDENSFAQQLSTLLSQRMRLQQILHQYGSVDALCAQIWHSLDLAKGTISERLTEEFCLVDALPAPVLRALANAMSLGSPTDQKAALALLQWLDTDPRQRPTLMSSYQSVFLTQKGEIKSRLITKKATTLFTLPEGYQDLPPEPDQLLRMAAEQMLNHHQKLLQCELAQASEALLQVGYAILQKFQDLKAQRAQMDYDDLIQATQTLLSQPETAQWVLYKLDGGLDHILIDEAQDTNPEQWDIVKALSQDFYSGQGQRDTPRTLFVVGDIKQSIYSFQRADPDRFQQMQHYFESAANQAEHPFATVPMVTSFRSTDTILGFVDRLFANPAYQSGVQSDPVHHAIARVGAPGKVTLWPLACAAEKTDPTHWQLPIPEHLVRPDNQDGQDKDNLPASDLGLLAQRIATEIKGWLDQKRQLPSQGRPVRAGDIMILIQRRPKMAAPLIAALHQAGLPVAGADRLQLSDSLAVQDLLALGQFCLLPEDDLTLATLLKSPLIGLSETDLFHLCRPWAKREKNRQHISLWSALSRYRPQDLATISAERAELTPEQMAPLTKAVMRLTEILNLADRLPPYEFYAQILVQMSGRTALLTRLGADSAEPIDEFLSLALLYERAHPPTLQGFLSWMGGGKTEIKREMDQSDQDQIRVMTIYGAKGLQAPIVIMPDANRIKQNSDRQFWPQTLDFPPHLRADWPAFLYAPQKKADLLSHLKTALQEKEMAEYRRLLYVALTRAEDELILCGTQNNKQNSTVESWYQMAQTTFETLVAEGQAQSDDLSDGFAQSDPENARWHGKYYSYQIQKETISLPAAAPVSQTEKPALPDLPEWSRQKAPIDPLPAKPLMPSRPDIEDSIAQSPLKAQQSDIFLRGRLIHRLLELLPSHPPADWERAARAYLALPLHDLTAAQQQNYWQEAERILSDADFAPLFGPNSQAEVSLTGIIQQKGRPTVISGQVDRLVVTAEKVMIIDFKTNRPPPRDPGEVPEIYRQQLQAYRLLLEDMYPDRQIQTLLLWTDTCHLMEIIP